jgi:tetraacyldisaccharide 4'-kinase
MRGDFIKINPWLKPLSWLYGIGVGFRNQLFELEILKSRSFKIPVISVGNITVGGSGKTPHVEYLIRLLQDKAKVAVLSRGYKRKSNGYVLAAADTTVEEIGDEPYQMKKKFPGIYVAVDKKRCHGIEQLTSDERTKDADVILLDDAFQHRYVKPGINILLVDYHRFITDDILLPAGRLREPVSAKNRADMVVITKCPKDLTAFDFRALTKAISLFPYQKLFFTTLEYGTAHQLFGTEQKALEDLKDSHLLLLTGIASPQQMELDLKPHCKDLVSLPFSDHHDFDSKDILRINQAFADMPSPKVIITTEKDATRLERLQGLSQEVRDSLFVLPVEIRFMQDQEHTFKHKIISYVRKNSKNSILAKRKDDNKPKDSHHTGNRPRTISFRNF